MTFVGFVRASNTADVFPYWATSASMSSLDASCIDAERHLDVVEAVADVAVGTEDPADVGAGSTVEVTERSWMPRFSATDDDARRQAGRPGRRT